MNSFQTKRYNCPESIAEAAATQFVDLLRQPWPDRQFHVAFSGGRMGALLFDALARVVLTAGAKFDGVHFYWADERCVPPDHPESNFAMAQSRLFNPCATPPAQVHRIRGELAAEQAAKLASEELQAFAQRSQDAQPVLDLVLLGMGEDGHVASLFPNEPEEVVQSPEIYRAVIGPKPPPRRVTLGYGTICAARRAWVLVSGKGKQEALKKSLQPSSDTPLGRVLSNRSGTIIFSDLI